MAKVHLIKPIENYTDYGLGTHGKMYHSAESLSGQGVVFYVAEDRYQTRGTTFTVSFWDANHVGRRETGGEVYQGAHAVLSANASMIYAGPRRPEPERKSLAYGDYLVLEGLDTILKVVAGHRMQGPQLEVVTTPEATFDESELVAAENAKPKRYISEAYLSG